jgi:predicted site-specific integrase-resolvase
MEYYTIGQFSKLVGKSIQTLRAWDKGNKLKPHHVTDGGHRYYSDRQVLEATKQPIPTRERKVIGYCRVSSPKQKDDLERQIENVKTYMIAKGYSFEIITDIGSGINYDKKGLNNLISLITDYGVEKVVIMYKDRLLRIGYELVENLCAKYGTSIEVIDNTEKTEEQELVEELVQIVTVLSCRLQGRRANKAKKMIKELLDDDNGKKSEAVADGGAGTTTLEICGNSEICI